MITEKQEKIYPIKEERITHIKPTLKYTIEQNRKEEISIEDLNLYEIDLDKIQIKNKTNQSPI